MSAQKDEDLTEMRFFSNPPLMWPHFFEIRLILCFSLCFRTFQFVRHWRRRSISECCPIILIICIFIKPIIFYHLLAITIFRSMFLIFVICTHGIAYPRKCGLCIHCISIIIINFSIQCGNLISVTSIQYFVSFSFSMPFLLLSNLEVLRVGFDGGDF